MQPADRGLKIPHMGWNTLMCARPSAADGIETGRGPHAYFVHSYHLAAATRTHVIATDYGGR